MSTKKTPMMITPTLDECMAAAVDAGMPESEGENMYAHYQLAGWKYGKARVPITSLALAVQNWKRGWLAGGSVNRPPVMGTSGGGMSGADKMIKQSEYLRVLERMKVLMQYDSHLDMPKGDREEYRKLKARRDELRKALDIMI